MMNRQLLSFLLVVLLLGFVSAPAVGAEDRPATPVPGPAALGVLATYSVDELPTPHAEVWFLRMGLEPNGFLPPDKQIGPTLIYVELGELTLVTDQPLSVSRSVKTPESAPVTSSPVAGDFRTVLHVGESALVADGTTVSATNDTNEPLTLLTVLMYSAVREVESDASGPEPVGVTTQGISIAPAEFAVGSGTITLERVQVAQDGTLQGEEIPPWGIQGLELGAIEHGSAEATFVSPAAFRWPNILGGEWQEREPIELTAHVTLTAGDGYSLSNGTSTWTPTGQEPLVLLRVVIRSEG